MKGKWVNKVAVCTGQCLFWWWWFVFESMVFGDVGFWVCDSEEWLITVRERDVFLWFCRKLFAWEKAGMDSTMLWRLLVMKMSLILWLLDVKKNIGFFFCFWHRKQNRNETGWLELGSVRFLFFFQNFDLVVFIGKNWIKPKIITPTGKYECWNPMVYLLFYP
jgi:hypothetical protein